MHPKAESDIQHLLLDAHDSTTYLIDNVPQDNTAEQLMNHLMDLQDESYAVMRLLTQSQFQNTTTTGSNSPSTSTAGPPNPQLSPQVITGSSDNNPRTSLRNDVQTSNVSCPKLKITPFDGNPMNWNLWFDSFKTLIDSKPLHDAKEMSKLQTLPVGRTSSMYQAALDELQHRLTRPDIIVNSFIEKLRTFKTPSFQNPTTFVEISSIVNNLVECFRHLGFKNDMNSTIYAQIAADKFSLNDRIRWNEYIVQNQKTRETMFDFNRWLRHFALACDQMPNLTQSNRPGKNIDERPRHAALFKRLDQPKCPLDNQNHYLGHCETLRNMSAANRKKKCLDLKRCFNCLGTHTVKECKSQPRCKSCNGTHHTLLHEPSSSNEEKKQPSHR